MKTQPPVLHALQVPLARLEMRPPPVCRSHPGAPTPPWTPLPQAGREVAPTAVTHAITATADTLFGFTMFKDALHDEELARAKVRLASLDV